MNELSYFPVTVTNGEETLTFGVSATSAAEALQGMRDDCLAFWPSWSVVEA